MKWPEVPLHKVALINPSRPRNLGIADDQLVTFVPMPAVSGQTACIENPEQRAYVDVKKGFTYFEENDVLLAKITPCMENGKSAIASNLMGGVGFGSTEFHVIRPNQSLLLAKYVHYFIRQQVFRDNAKARMRGAVGQQRVPKDFLDDTNITLRPISEQNRIVEILDKADNLRKMRAEADKKAERVLTTLFIKMFGDPITNPMKWKEISLGSHFKVVTGNTPSTKVPEYYGDYIPWARPADLDNSILVNNSQKLLSKKGKEVARIVPPKSILVVCIGATLGKVAMAGVELAINQQINAILAYKDMAPEFLYVQCLLIADRFRAAATKSTLPILNKSQFGSQKIIYPPEARQKIFVQAAHKMICSHKDRIVSKEHIEMLFNVLLHGAFSGGLTSSWREARMNELMQEMEIQEKALAS